MRIVVLDSAFAESMPSINSLRINQLRKITLYSKEHLLPRC